MAKVMNDGREEEVDCGGGGGGSEVGHRRTAIVLSRVSSTITTDIRLLSAGNSHLKYQTLLKPLVISTLPLYLILNAAYISLWKCDISPFEACSDPAKDQSGVRLGMGGGLTFGNAIRDCLYVFVFVSNHLLVCFSVCLLQVGGGRLG